MRPSGGRRAVPPRATPGLGMDGDFYSFVASYDVHKDVSFNV